jgi:hypothetical protein
MVLGGGVIAGAGLLLIVMGLVWTDAMAWLYRLAGPGTTTEFGPAAMLGVAIYGGVMVGWGWTLVMIGNGRPTELAVGMGVIVWWVTDSAASIASGYPLNVLGNLGFLALFTPLFVALWRARGGSAALASGARS